MKTFILLGLLPLALAVPTTAPSGSCAQVGIITARASTEAPGEGVIGTLAAAIQSSSTQTVSRTAVVYPALLEPYAPSVASGVAAMTADLEAAVKACPDQKIVLLGYSQGGKHFCFKLSSIRELIGMQLSVLAIRLVGVVVELWMMLRLHL
jgi:acetylxylan esterase